MNPVITALVIVVMAITLFLPVAAISPTDAICTSDWQCSLFEPCLENGMHSRVCADLNYCITPSPMPATQEDCEHTPPAPSITPIISDSVISEQPVVAEVAY